ncbi:MAG: helix-turn-helix domain-containing protein [Crocinitomix sp.]|nr:helix-turn-helix domain-containing protein [Crocinitomix sp.]
MTQKEKFEALVSNEKTDTIAKNKARIKNRKRLRESQAIAMKVLDKLDELGWSQRQLAKAMEVSPQQITKIVSGKENLTLDTQVRLQDALDIPILATYLEKQIEQILSSIKLQSSQNYSIPKKKKTPEMNEEKVFRINKRTEFNASKKSHFHYEKTA